MRNLNKILTAVTLLATLFVATPSAHATNINQEILELKQKYENAYKRYTTAIKEGATSTIQDIKKQYEQAKAKYDEARKRLTLSDSTKKTIKESVDTVKETISDTFAYGNGNTIDLSTDNENGGKTLKGYKDYKVSIDGNNYCGQFATTLLFDYYGIRKDGNKVYSETNPAGIFTAPPTIIEYLNRNGLDANEKNNASIQDLVKRLDAGTPVVCLVSSDDTPHWITVCGYKTDSDGKITHLQLRDSVWGVNKVYDMKIDEFKKVWNNPLGSTSLYSHFIGYSNLMIDIKGTKKPDKSPSLFNVNFSTATQDNISSGINDVVTGFRNLQPTTFLGGVTKCALGIPGAVFGIGGEVVSGIGSKMVEWGKKEWSEGGIGDKIAGGAAVVTGYLAQGAGSIVKAGGNLLSSVANAGGNLMKKLGSVFS